MYSIRHWIKIIEAATYHGGAYWFNPQTKQIIPASDHGQAVIDDPDAFGIDRRTQFAMDAAFPEDEDDDYRGWETDDRSPPAEMPPELWGGREGWYRNDAWEVLAMNRGWVRIGSATSISTAYVSSSTAESVWAAVKYLVNKNGINAVDIEIARPENQVFANIGGEELTRFLKGGARKANAFLLKNK